MLRCDLGPNSQGIQGLGQGLAGVSFVFKPGVVMGNTEVPDPGREMGLLLSLGWFLSHQLPTCSHGRSQTKQNWARWHRGQSWCCGAESALMLEVRGAEGANLFTETQKSPVPTAVAQASLSLGAAAAQVPACQAAWGIQPPKSVPACPGHAAAHP